MSRFEDLYLMTRTAVYACPLCPQTYEYREPAHPSEVESDMYLHITSEHTVSEAVTEVARLRATVRELTAEVDRLTAEKEDRDDQVRGDHGAADAPTYVVEVLPGQQAPLRTRVGILVTLSPPRDAEVQWTGTGTGIRVTADPAVLRRVDFTEDITWPGHWVVRRDALGAHAGRVEVGITVGEKLRGPAYRGKTDRITVRWLDGERAEVVDTLVAVVPLTITEPDTDTLED